MVYTLSLKSESVTLFFVHSHAELWGGRPGAARLWAPATSSSRSLSGLVFDQWELSRFHCLHGLKNLQIFFWFKYDDNWFSMISSEFQWWELIFRVNFWCLDSGSAPVMRSTKRTLPVRSRFQCLKEWNAWASCRGIIFIWRIWYDIVPFLSPYLMWVLASIG